MGGSRTTREGLHFFMKLKRYVNNLNVYNRSRNGTNLWDDLTSCNKRKLSRKLSRKIKIVTSKSLVQFLLILKGRHHFV